MDKWEYKFVQLEYVEYERMPRNWKLLSIRDDGEISTVLQDVVAEFTTLGDDGWEIAGIVPGGPTIPTTLDNKGQPLLPSMLGATVGPRAGGLVILKRLKL